MGTYVGKSVIRIDGPERVSGQAVYAPDIQLPHMLYGAVARSARAHARLLRVDAEAARLADGVAAVITGDMVPYEYGNMIADQPFLARHKVCYYGEPLALVIAETELQAQLAASLIQAEYEDLPAVFDPREALKAGAPLIHEDQTPYRRDPERYPALTGTNLCNETFYSLGDVDAAFAEADRVFEHSFFSHPTSHTAMEPFASVARYDATRGEYLLITTTDAPHRRLGELAAILGVGQEKIRVRTTAQGGGFGGKGCLYSEVLALAGAMFAKGRPVKYVFSREEVLSMSGTRMGAYLTLKSGLTRDGRIIARSSDVLWDNGPYSSKSPEVAYRGTTTSVGPYNIPNISIRARLVYTNNYPSTSFRGFGTTQSAYACEMHMDMIAHEMGLDPLDFRRRHALRQCESYINGQTMISVGLPETLERAAEEIGWDSPKPQARPGKAVGRGLACMLKGTNTPRWVNCIVRMGNDAGVKLHVGTMEIGAGQRTAMAQIAAETLGLDISRIRVPQQDTDYTPFDFGTTSSGSTFHMGNCVKQACEDLLGKLFACLGNAHGLDPAGFRAAGDRIVHAGGGFDKSYAEAVRSVYPRGGDFVGEALYTPAGMEMLKAAPGVEKWSSAFWMFSSHAAEVEVDLETGQVDVLRIAAAHDVGRAINPLHCVQQIEGSVIMGASMALGEEYKVSPEGRILTDSLLDYKVATSKDIPRRITPIIVESEHPFAPYGAKGVGEPAAGCTPPAIANAIHDAVGVWMNSLPITPEKLFLAMRRKNSGTD